MRCRSNTNGRGRPPDLSGLVFPFAGEGANLAKYDGAKLNTAITDNPENIASTLSVYEEVIFRETLEL
jgi:2-polyprenyl-6-methoxyphenol hydroxylase-like FAD-dependent oxidoreductase